jgi:hypothetical protein
VPEEKVVRTNIKIRIDIEREKRERGMGTGKRRNGCRVGYQESIKNCGMNHNGSEILKINKLII